MLHNSLVYERAFAFAVRIVHACKHLQEQKKEFVLSKQMLRGGISIGANIAEANGAISDAGFSSKMSVAYKESFETKSWLLLLKETNYLTEKNF